MQASPAALLGEESHAPTASADPIAEVTGSFPPPANERATAHASPKPSRTSVAPPRPNGKAFTTAAIDRNGRTRHVEIRIRDGVAETRVDDQVIAPDRVLVHRRGAVEIVDASGRTDLWFNLPRGMTSVTQLRR